LKVFDDIIRNIIFEELTKNDKVLRGKIEADNMYFLEEKNKAKRGRGSSNNKVIVFWNT
jgi:hypothetical protein